ncbi:MAG TPA: murein L,D-transpeptidase catalytic domain family protein [Puia sp.]|nr:murein L,D-transpeptidase catalytic domain family protein [Puia sp.]
MKTTTTNSILRFIAIMIILIAPATLVEGKNEIDRNISNKINAFSTFHSADAIKKFISYTVSATPVYTKTAEVENLLKSIAVKAEMKMVARTAISIYDEMDLEDSGLDRKAFEYAWMGYYKLQKKGVLHKTGILSICDFSQSSSKERMYVIDVRHRKLLYRTFVAHGINSGEEFANSFSNTDESCKSSLGFYVTSNTYVGINGLSLRINGVDKGFNDHASRRNIVIHGAPYVSLRILHKYGVMGTTFGCPAIPTEMSTQIIPAVKNGTCFFIYYPSKKYLAQSTVLNG